MNKEIKEFIENIFKNDYSGHDYDHTIRVYNMAMHIAKFEKCDTNIVELASLLHDVDDRKLFDTHEKLSNAKVIMKKLNIPNDTMDKVLTIINEVSFKGSDTVKPSTIEGMIVQDADRLDAIGAIGIARCFMYGGNHNRKLYDPNILPKTNMNEEEYFANQNTTINHFYEKLLLLKDLMNTSEGKKIAIKRHEFLCKFLDEFMDEWNFK